MLLKLKYFEAEVVVRGRTKIIKKYYNPPQVVGGLCLARFLETLLGVGLKMVWSNKLIKRWRM